MTPRRLLELTDCEAVKRAAMAGLGVTMVSAHSVELEVRCGERREVEVPEPRLARDLDVVTRKDVRLSAAALAFLALARGRA